MPKLTDSVTHEGKVYEAGEEAPKGADLDRLKRLGKIEGHEAENVSEVPAERPDAERIQAQQREGADPPAERPAGRRGQRSNQ